MSNFVTEINSKDFETIVLKASNPVLVDFWAPWCGPCRAIAPVLESIAQEYTDKLKVVKVNVDDNGDLANKYSITSIPTLFLFKDGKVIDQIIGAVNKSFLKDFIDKHI